MPDLSAFLSLKEEPMLKNNKSIESSNFLIL